MRDGFAAEDAEKAGISNFKLQSEKCKGAGATNPPTLYSFARYKSGTRANTWVRPYVLGKPSPLSLRLM
jgi:hypothetical protein